MFSKREYDRFIERYPWITWVLWAIIMIAIIMRIMKIDLLN